MMNMNGLEATRSIRALGFSGQIIAVSGNVLPEDVEAFLAAGANIFLAKPLQRKIFEKFFARFCQRVNEGKVNNHVFSCLCFF